MNESPHHLTLRRARVCLTAVFSVLSMAGLSLGPGPPSAGQVADARGASPAASVPPGPTDAELRTMIEGRWKTIASGERIVTNRPDGTATMDLTFDFIPSLRYGTKMKLNLTWTIEKGILAYTITSGDPEAMVARLIADYGDYATYSFKSIAGQRMHLVRIIDSDESYVWMRVD